MQTEGLGTQHIYTDVTCLFSTINVAQTQNIQPYTRVSHSTPEKSYSLESQEKMCMRVNYTRLRIVCQQL